MSEFNYSFNLNFCKKTAPLAIVFNGEEAEIRRDIAVPESALLVGYIAGHEIVTFCDEIGGGTNLRTLMLELEYSMLTAVNRARQLVNHQRIHRFCGSCGTKTVLSSSETALICPECSAVFYPRLDPAVIVAIQKDNKILLAHNSRFKNNIYGLIAGFIEGGESLEMAVAREVREEVGLEVKNIRYFHSQFWPFPNSFMLGCFAEYAGGEITPDGEEITDANFFGINELPNLPSPGSVARKIIDFWCNKQQIQEI